jgi:DNA primase
MKKQMFDNSISQRTSVFNTVKEIPAVDVARRFGVDMQKKGGRWLACCPLHDDKSPSFSLYRERFKCFGCGWSGDAVDLVAALEHLKPLDAAREIARSFGLDDGQGMPMKRSAVLKLQKERAAKQKVDGAFKEWRKRTFYGISLLLRACEHILAGNPELPGYAEACHLQPKLEYLFDVLSGPVEDQVKFFEEYGWEWTA